MTFQSVFTTSNTARRIGSATHPDIYEIAPELNEVCPEGGVILRRAYVLFQRQLQLIHFGQLYGRLISSWHIGVNVIIASRTTLLLLTALLPGERDYRLSENSSPGDRHEHVQTFQHMFSLPRRQSREPLIPPGIVPRTE